jgi:hypothetical protein
MVGDGANAFDHLERAGKLRVEVASRPWQQGLSRAAKDPQPDPVVDGELECRMVTAIVLLGILLGL